MLNQLLQEPQSQVSPGSSTVVVLSGGQDSTTCLFWACNKFERVHAVTFNYNQRHSVELKAARDVLEIANYYRHRNGLSLVTHEQVDIGPILKGNSPLTDLSAELETYKDFEQMDKTIGDRIELTFVPMRNSLFLTLASNRAICLGIHSLTTGVCQEDNANYPDCRDTFIAHQRSCICSALGLPLQQFQIHTPLMYLSKANTVQLAISEGAYTALAWSHTAYDGKHPPSGSDHASILRAHGFEQRNLPDPLVYRAFLLGDLPSLPTSRNYGYDGKEQFFADLGVAILDMYEKVPQLK